SPKAPPRAYGSQSRRAGDTGRSEVSRRSFRVLVYQNLRGRSSEVALKGLSASKLALIVCPRPVWPRNWPPCTPPVHVCLTAGDPMKQDKHPVEVAVRALDVGYFNTKYTLGRALNGDSNPIQVAMFPSIAPALTATDMLGSKG